MLSDELDRAMLRLRTEPACLAVASGLAACTLLKESACGANFALEQPHPSETPDLRRAIRLRLMGWARRCPA